LDAVTIGGIAASSAYTMTIAGAGSFAAQSILINDQYALLNIQAAIAVPAMTLDAGTLNINNAVLGSTALTANGGTLISNGGSLQSLSINGSLLTEQGTLSVGTLALGSGTLFDVDRSSLTAAISANGGTLANGGALLGGNVQGSLALAGGWNFGNGTTLAGAGGSGAGTLAHFPYKA
jgi:hypothetical protein